MEKQSISICSVGDLMLCDSPLYVSVGLGTSYHQIRNKLYSACEADIQSSDIVIGNLETVFYKPKRNSLKERQMACDREPIEDLKRIGFNVVSFSNNHCLQHGYDSYQNTIKLCNELSILTVGQKGENVKYMEIKGETVAFLSLCLVYERYQPNDIKYEDSIIQTIRKVRRIRNENNSILIVVSIHWGDEFTTCPSNAQIKLGHVLVESGANLILGHHSHVFQGIERYKSGLIVYGQGNFISDMKPSICTETGIVKIIAQKEKTAFKLDYKVIPYKISNNYILVADSGDWLTERKQHLDMALHGQISDEKYWKMKTENHKLCHNTFKTYFTTNIWKYSINISTRMIVEFGLRKLGKINGSYVSGRKANMDRKIYEELKVLEKGN